MLSFARKAGGRAFAVLVWGIGLATIVIMTILFLFSCTENGQRNWLALAEIAGAYFVMMGMALMAGQAGNAAERLPGIRKFEGQYRGHGEDRRAGDSRELEEK